MRIYSQLIAETENSSLSVITIAGEFLCFILEDGFRMKKEPGKALFLALAHCRQSGRGIDTIGNTRFCPRLCVSFLALHGALIRHCSITMPNFSGFSQALIPAFGALIVGKISTETSTRRKGETLCRYGLQTANI